MEIKISGRYLDFRADYYEASIDIVKQLNDKELDYWDICGFGCHVGPDLRADDSTILISDKAIDIEELKKVRIIKDISDDFFSDEQKKVVKEYRKSTIGEYQKERRRYFSGGVGDLVEILAYSKGEAFFNIDMNSPFAKENLFIMSMDLLGFEGIELLHSFGYKEDDGSITWSGTGELGDQDIKSIDIYLNEVLV